MLRAINRVHIGWQQQSLMYINEHILSWVVHKSGVKCH